MSQKHAEFIKKHEKVVLWGFASLVLAIFVLIIYYIATLEILQDYKNGEKYSIADKISYQIRCNGQRAIRLREIKPGASLQRIPDHYETLEYKPYTLSVDWDGFVLPSFVHEKPDLQMFFLGGSTTENEFIDQEYRFPYLVGRQLEEKLHKKINSDNGARSGNNSIHSINILINKILPKRPDIVVMMHNVNDLTTLMHEGSYWNLNKSRSNLQCALKNSTYNEKDEWDKNQKLSLTPEFQTRIARDYKENLQLFINICKAKNITPVLMTMPNRIEGNESFAEISRMRGGEFADTYQRMFVKFNEIVRQTAKENKVFYIDLASKVPQDKKYIYDQVHLNKEGSILVAGIITEELGKIIKK